MQNWRALLALDPGTLSRCPSHYTTACLTQAPHNRRNVAPFVNEKVAPNKGFSVIVIINTPYVSHMD